MLQGIEDVLSDEEFGTKLDEFKEFFRYWNNNLINLARESFRKKSEAMSNTTALKSQAADTRIHFEL